MSYADKLTDPRWQRRRLEILERDGWCCRNCGNARKTLHVHHRWYVSRREPWEYPDVALVTLCKNCHADETDSGLSVQDWELLLGNLEAHQEIFGAVKGMSRMLALHSKVVRFEGDRLEFMIPQEHRHLLEKPYRDNLLLSLEQHYGRKLKLEFSLEA